MDEAAQLYHLSKLLDAAERLEKLAYELDDLRGGRKITNQSAADVASRLARDIRIEVRKLQPE